MRGGVRAALDRAAAVGMLRQVEAFAVDGASADEMAAGCAVLDVVEDGRTVGAVAVDVVDDVATITAAFSEGADTYAELSAIEEACRRIGCKRMRVQTKRPGLMRQLARRGWIAEMEKEL